MVKEEGERGGREGGREGGRGGRERRSLYCT